MNNEHSVLIDITKRRPDRTPKCVAGKTDEQVADELFTGHQTARVDFIAELDYYDSPIFCPDRIRRTCGIDHGFRPDFRNTRISIDVIPQILRVKNDGIS
ncbi:MAG: hypothetical protein WCF23_10045 [Candidatus Nitrosopolaris sp.]